MPIKPWLREEKKEEPISVKRKEGELIESLIRRFKKKVIKNGIIQEVKERNYYEKPSDKRKRKKKESIRRIKRTQQKNEFNFLRSNKKKGEENDNNKSSRG